MAKKKVVKDETKVDTRELFAALAALAEEILAGGAFRQCCLRR